MMSQLVPQRKRENGQVPLYLLPKIRMLPILERLNRLTRLLPTRSGNDPSPLKQMLRVPK
jgi:hypothetical protein